MKNQSFDTVKKQLAVVGQFFYSHSKLIYFALFMLVLIAAVLSVNLALSWPSDDGYRNEKLTEVTSPRFDEETIEKINNLNAKQQTATEPIPTNQRTNPFGE